MMDDARREALQERLQAFDEAAEPFRCYVKQAEDLLSPWRQALASIADARDSLLEAHGVEIAGTCEECHRLLFAGEMGCAPFADEKSIIYCEACAPTWADIQAALPADPAHDTDHQAAVREGLAEATFSLEAKPLYCLDAELGAL